MTADRWRRFRELLVEVKADAVVLSGLPNIRYLTGFTGSNALLLAHDGGALLFTDGRYQTQAAEEVRGARVTVAKGSLVRALTASVKRRRVRRLAFESRRMTHDVYESLRTGLPGCRLIPTAGLVERLRMIKSSEEIAAVRRAADLNSTVFEACLKEIRPGRSEADVAARIEYLMRKRGGEKPAFETIVAGGARSALPHARASGNPLKKKELILIDQGVILGGYSSDMTRTVALGGLGSEARKVYHAVLEAQLEAISAVRAGIQAREVDRRARVALQKHGLEYAFVHSTGHGVGLEIHEPPRLGRGETTRLEAGMVVTIEPGAYVEGLGGVRIEDMVLVTGRGCEILTRTPKELRVL